MALFTYEQLYGTMGHRLSKALFFEVCKPEDTPLFTLGRKPKRDLVVLRDIFVDMVATDPTEFEFAEYVFGDYAFWENMSKATWLKPHLEEWRMVAEVKRKSMGFKGLISEVQNKGRNAYGAAKYLIDEPWKPKTNKKVREDHKRTTEIAHQGLGDDIARLKDFM